MKTKRVRRTALKLRRVTEQLRLSPAFLRQRLSQECERSQCALDARPVMDDDPTEHFVIVLDAGFPTGAVDALDRESTCLTGLVEGAPKHEAVKTTSP